MYNGVNTDSDTSRGFPRDRVVGVHRLGDYREANALSFSKPFLGGGNPIEVSVPTGRYVCMRFLVSANAGPATLKGQLRFQDGSEEPFEVLVPDWFHDAGRPGPARNRWDVTTAWDRMDRFYEGKFQDVNDPALFDLVLPTDRAKKLEAVIIEPSRCRFRRQISVIHVYALTGMLLTEN